MADLALTVDHDGEVPPFEQVKQQVRDAVDSGVLAPGDKLPPVRSLAAELGLATNTVARAYKELEALGVVATRGRAGTIVQGRGLERSAREAAATYVTRIKELGLDDAEALDLVRRALG
jgi:DNA-binding transcriptional regulator YhcF (GntR family)